MNNKALEEIKVNNWAQRLRGLLLLTAILFLGFMGYEFYGNQSKSKSDAAFATLFVAEQMEEKSLESSAATESGMQIETVISRWTAEEKSKYVSALELVVRDHSKSVAAQIAGLKLGRFYFFEGSLDKSKEYLELVVKQSREKGLSVVYRVLALESLGALYETQNDFDQAIAVFLQASDLKNNPLRPVSYLNAARVLKNQGKAEEAEKFYNKVITEFPNTDFEKQARALMALKVSG
jgi:tetratricopeptide (TPR) repeat protein